MTYRCETLPPTKAWENKLTLAERRTLEVPLRDHIDWSAGCRSYQSRTEHIARLVDVGWRRTLGSGVHGKENNHSAEEWAHIREREVGL